MYLFILIRLFFNCISDIYAENIENTNKKLLLLSKNNLTMTCNILMYIISVFSKYISIFFPKNLSSVFMI